MAQQKNISYINKNFTQYKASLIDFAKNYFPNTYTDFSEASPGSMFIEMASYVGDVLSFYTDTQIQENFVLTAQDKSNLLNMAYSLGYRPKSSYASVTVLDFYQRVPMVGGSPILDYALIIPENTSVKSVSTGVNFITLSKVDFTDTSSVDISLYDSSTYLFKKSVRAISAEVKTISFQFTVPVKFNSVEINDPNFLQILSVYGEGNDNSRWYEVPYLAQSTVIDKNTNTGYNKDKVPYLINMIDTPNRFVSRIKTDDVVELQFGSGMYVSELDTNIIPTPDTIQLGLIPSADTSDLVNNYNEASVFYTKQYGLVPSNLTLNVQYLSGGGINSNVPSNDINTIPSTAGIFAYEPLRTNASLATLIVNNAIPASGGRGGDTVEEIRLNTLNAFSSQLRSVTKDDYMTRALSMPSEFGTISKVYVEQASALSVNSGVDPLIDNNPLALSMYVLAYNDDKKLENASNELKSNLKQYISPFIMATDSVIIKDAFYINLGINFDITVIPGLNSNQIISNCINKIIDYFNIDKWQINQPIILSTIYSLLLQVPGVQSVVKFDFVNKSGGNYSPYSYDVVGAIRSDVLYPSLDPAIFEIRFPDLDIQGRVRTF
jgi:hypothetical protein